MHRFDDDMRCGRRGRAAAFAVAMLTVGVAVAGCTPSASGHPRATEPTASLSPSVTPAPSTSASELPSPAFPSPTVATTTTASAEADAKGSPSEMISAKVPIVYCPTDDGSYDFALRAPTSPTSDTVQLPAPLVGKVTEYRDYEGTEDDFGPAGWQCEAAVGVDDSKAFIVAPASTGEASSATGAGPTISRYTSGADNNEAWELACGLAPSPNALTDDWGTKCDTPRPADETVTTRVAADSSHTTVWFVDPPTAATPYTTFGRLDFFPAQYDDESQRLICQLPDDLRAICDLDVRSADEADEQASPLAAETGAPSTGPQLPQTDVPVVYCPTVGASGSAAPGPTTTPLPVSGAPASMIVYRDASGRLSVLAPSNWQCAANVSSDGSLSLIVVPPGTSTASPQPFVRDNRAAVSAILVAPGSAAVFDLTCATMPGKTGEACPARIPEGEKNYNDVPNVVGFYDPPGIVGDGAPSGGKYDSWGEVIYRPAQGSTPDDAASTTCAIPNDDDGTLCNMAVAAFDPFGTASALGG